MRREPSERLIGFIGAHQAVAKRRRRPLAELVKAAEIEQLAWHAAGTRGVEADLASITDDLGDEAGELGDDDVLAAPDIDELGLRIALHQTEAGIRHVVDIKEFARGKPVSLTTTFFAPASVAS